MLSPIVETTAALTVQSAQPLDQNPAAVYLASLGKSSRRTMLTALRQLSAIISGDSDPLRVNWSALGFQHTAAIRAQLAEGMTSGNANKHLFALRGVLKAARNLGQMTAEDYSRAVAFTPIQGETLPKGRALTSGEIAALLDACIRDETTDGPRDAALIALLRVGGLRRAEVCNLQLEDYEDATGALRVQGKGNKERMVYVSASAAEAIADWLAVRGSEAGALFQPITKGGRIERRHMTPQAVYDVLAKRAREAGVTNLSPHDFRRTFASDLLDAGADIATVQHLMGHANIQTTAKYDRRGEAAKRQAVNLLHVPYRRRAFGEIANQ